MLFSTNVRYNETVNWFVPQPQKAANWPLETPQGLSIGQPTEKPLYGEK